MNHQEQTDLERATERLRVEFDQKLAGAEEKQKSRDPNIISALRTFLHDSRAYAQGERADFPQEALIGVVGAWLRPRLVILFGSLFALILGAGEFYLIYKQNQIIERQAQIMADQNQLAEEQSRINKAQTISTLLPALSDEHSLDTHMLLAAYGDVTVDVLWPLVKLGLPNPGVSYSNGDVTPSRRLWLNSAKVLAQRKEHLSGDDRKKLFDLILDAIDWSRQLVRVVPMEKQHQSPLKPFHASQKSAQFEDSSVLLYSRLLQLAGEFLISGKSPGFELTDTERRTVLTRLAGIYSFAYGLRYDPHAEVWVDQGTAFLNLGLQSSELCPYAWAHPEDANFENVMDNVAYLLHISIQSQQLRPMEASMEETIKAIVVYACAPETLSPEVREDAKMIRIAKSASPALINHPPLE